MRFVENGKVLIINHPDEKKKMLASKFLHLVQQKKKSISQTNLKAKRKKEKKGGNKLGFYQFTPNYQ